MFRIFLIISILPSLCFAQLEFKDQRTDLGAISEAYEIIGDVIIKNAGLKKIFLLRADADKGVKVFTSKKTLQANDTALLIISFLPESAGKFKKKISLVSSDSENSYMLELSGNLGKLKKDDKMACFFFGSRKRSNVKTKDEPIVVGDPKEPRDNSNKIPDHSAPPTYSPVITFKETKTDSLAGFIADTSKLSILKYKPNNILFLVDVSGSMKDSLKLPVMQKALNVLIDAVRDVDRITFVTYSEKTKIIKEAVSGEEKATLKKIVSSLQAKGLTIGNEAILKSQSIVQKHFIAEGNNQIIMASDGEFQFNKTDHQKWLSNQGNKKIILTTVAFGSNKKAIKNLKDISEKGEGSFIQMTDSNSKDALLEEIMKRSKR